MAIVVGGGGSNVKNEVDLGKLNFVDSHEVGMGKIHLVMGKSLL